jgi:putative oxidoreductase
MGGLTMTFDRKLQISLLALRLGVATVMFMWAWDRVTNYAHNAKVTSHYYHLDLSQPVLTGLGIVQLAILTGFLLGRAKTLTYGYVLLAHLGATIASAHQMLPPYERHQLLYFGALPMLAACLALFLLREEDKLLSLKLKK